jgi:hypothetical protein
VSDAAASVLEADGEATPVEERPDLQKCEICGKETNRLGLHRWNAHKIRKDKGEGGSSKPSSPSRKSKDLRGKLQVSIGLVGTGVGLLDKYDGKVIDNGAPALAEALADWADADPKARKIIEMMAFDAPWFGVCMVLVSMGFPIAAHHGLVKNVPPMFGGLAPKGAAPMSTTPTPPPAGEGDHGTGSMPTPEELAAAMRDPEFIRFAQSMGMGGFIAPMTAQPAAETPAPMGEAPAAEPEPELVVVPVTEEALDGTA